MKTQLNKYIALFLVVGTFTSCYQDTIRPTELVNYQEKMVINGVFTSDASLSFELTTSEASIANSLPSVIKDATVTLVRSNTEQQMAYDVVTENYVSASMLVADESVAVRIQHPSLPNCNAVVRIPKNLGATGTLTPNGGVDTGGLPGDLLQVTFKDQPSQNNFYKINVYYRNETLGQWIPINFDKRDPSLAEYNSYTLNDAGVLFSDELFSGSTKVLSIVAPSGIVAGNNGDKYLIELSNISEDYFSYFRSLQRAQDAKEISFQGGYNNAVVIHSNVNGGLGILGTQNTSSIVLN
ncbi:MAG: hypothetical protein ACI80H_000175 [Pseudoalteromonas distincta]|jgi:hypothetical protein